MTVATVMSANNDIDNSIDNGVEIVLIEVRFIYESRTSFLNERS